MMYVCLRMSGAAVGVTLCRGVSPFVHVPSVALLRFVQCTLYKLHRDADFTLGKPLAHMPFITGLSRVCN